MTFVTTAPHLERLFQDYVIDRCTDLARRSELLFIALFALISIALSTAAEYLLSPLVSSSAQKPQWLAQGVAFIVFMALVIGPILETLLLQQLPITLAKLVGASRILQFLAGSIPFAVLHFEAGIVSGIAAGVVGGAVLSLAYLTFVTQSKTKAFVITTAIHSLHNLVPVLFVIEERV